MRRWPKITACLLLVAGLIALPFACQDRATISTHPATSPTTPARGELSLLTYNVEFNQGTPTATIDAIRDADADVVCLQECNAGWENTIENSLATKYPHTHFDHPPPNDPSGLAILSKFPIASATKLAPGDRGWFPASLAIVETPLGRIQILNVHLRPLISDSGSKIKGYFTVDSMHRAEIESLHRNVDANMPTVILGDFNESNDGKATAWLTSHGYTDVLPQFDRKTPTWHGKVYGIGTTYRDDHVFVSKLFQSVDAKVLKAGASDHYPVLAKIAAK